MKLTMIKTFAPVFLLLGSSLCHSVFAADELYDGPQALGSTLEDFYLAAVEYSPYLRISEERWKISSARKDMANGQLLPQINANANLSQNERTTSGVTSPRYDGSRYSLQLSQVLFNWQAFASRSQAYLEEHQSEAEYYGQLAALLTDVSDRYLKVLQAEDTLMSIEAELDAMSNQVDQIQKLYDLQLAKITDLYEAQARRAALQSELVDAQSSLLINRESLRAVSGLEAGDLSRLPDEINITPLTEPLAMWISRTNENNQLIEARNYALQVADKRVSERKGAYMPRVSLVLQQQQTNLGYDNISISKADSTYVGLDFTMPLYAGGRNKAGIREAQSMRNIAQSELRQATLELIEKTRTAYFQVKSGESRVDAARILAESTATSFNAMKRGFELGTVTSVDLLNALRDQFRAERDLQRARYEHIRAMLLLKKESGVLAADDLLEISNMLISG